MRQVEVVECRPEQHGAEHDERDGVEQLAELVDEERHLAAVGRPADDPEHKPARRTRR